MDQSISAENLLLDALYSANGLQHILNVAAANIGKPLILMDEANLVLAKTAGAFPLAEYLALNGNSAIVQTPDGPVRTITLDEQDTLLLVNIYTNGLLTARLGICNTGEPITDDMMHFAQQVCKSLSIELRKTSHSFFNSPASNRLFLEDLLERRLVADELIDNRLQSLNWHPKDTFIVFAVQLHGKDYGAFQLSNIQDTLFNLIPNSLFTANELCITMLITLPMGKFLPSSTLAVLSKYLLSNNLRGGISSQFIDLRNTYYAQQQALVAIELSEKLRENRVLSFYDDHAINHMLDQCSLKIRLTSLCVPTIFRLQEYDRTHTTKLTGTLRCYLDNAQDINKTAADCIIHRNTLTYRLDKLKEILRTDFSTGQDIMRLNLTFQILDYLEKIL